MFIKKIFNSKNICMFVVRSTSIYPDASTETKIQREPTVESTAVIFKHRLDVDRRDSLLVINQKLFIMRSTNDERATGTPRAPLNAEQIIEDLLLQDDPQRMRMLLRGMADNYLLEENESSFRRAAWDCYAALDLLLQRVEQLRNERERRAA